MVVDGILGRDEHREARRSEWSCRYGSHGEAVPEPPRFSPLGRAPRKKGATWVCISQGFPGLPFFVDEDLTRADGVIVCRQITELELVQIGWRAVRALSILSRLPIFP